MYTHIQIHVYASLYNLAVLENWNYLCKIRFNVTIQYTVIVIKGRLASHVNKHVGCSVDGSVRSRSLSATGVHLSMQRQSRLLQFLDG